MGSRRGKRYSQRPRAAKFAKVNEERKQEAAAPDDPIDNVDLVESEETLECVPKDVVGYSEAVLEMIKEEDAKIMETVVEIAEASMVSEAPVETETAIEPTQDIPEVTEVAEEPVKAPVTPKKKQAKKKSVKKDS